MTARKRLTDLVRAVVTESKMPDTNPFSGVMTGLIPERLRAISLAQFLLWDKREQVYAILSDRNALAITAPTIEPTNAIGSATSPAFQPERINADRTDKSYDFGIELKVS